MPVQTKVNTEVHVTTWSQVILDVAQNVYAVWLILLDQRGLTSDKLHEQKKIILDGLFTWILLRHLKSAYLEIYQDGLEQNEERWDLLFNYEDTEAEIGTVKSAEESWRIYLVKMSEIMARLKALPTNSTYRVIVDLVSVNGREPPKVKGWGQAKLKSIEGLEKIIIGDKFIDTGLIGAGMVVWGKLSVEGRTNA